MSKDNFNEFLKQLQKQINEEELRTYNEQLQQQEAKIRLKKKFITSKFFGN